MDKKKILDDHKKEKNKFITPFNYKFKGLNEISWVDTIIPELIWIAMIIKYCGEKSGVTAAAELCKIATQSTSIEGLSFYGTMSSFKLISDDIKKKILNKISRDNLLIISESLGPFAVLYPENTLSFLLTNYSKRLKSECIKIVSSVVEEIFDKKTRLAITTQATLMYFGFVTEKLHVMKGLILENFPEIQNYPKTELSIKVAAAIRSSTPIFISQQLEITGNEWSYYFWNKGLKLSSCRID